MLMPDIYNNFAIQRAYTAGKLAVNLQITYGEYGITIQIVQAPWAMSMSENVYLAEKTHITSYDLHNFNDVITARQLAYWFYGDMLKNSEMA